MVKLRDGKRTEPNTLASGDATQKRKAPTAGGRDGSSSQPAVEAKKPRLETSHETSTGASKTLNSCGRTRTPPPAGEPQQQPRTPGRIGPIQESCQCEPDIKPFRGEKGHKVRKSAFEKDQEYKDFIRRHEGHPFHDLYVCYDKGPNGSPTYDKAGFELDYKKVAHWMKPVSPQSLISERYNKYIDKMVEEGKRKLDIFFGDKRDSRSEKFEGVAQDRVSKDLQIPYHKVGLAEFEEWERRGFPKANLDEVASSTTQADRDRLLRMATGSSLRK